MLKLQFSSVRQWNLVYRKVVLTWIWFTWDENRVSQTVCATVRKEWLNLQLKQIQKTEVILKKKFCSLIYFLSASTFLVF